MKKTKTSKKLLCLLLSLAMLMTMIPGMAFAETDEGDTDIVSVRYLQDLKMFCTVNNQTAYLENFDFDPQTQEYNIAIPESWAQMKTTVELKENPSASDNIYAKWTCEGQPKALKEQKLNAKTTTLSITLGTIGQIKIGKKGKIVLTVGEKNEDGTYSNTDVYTFNVVRKACYAYTPSVAMEDGTKLTMSFTSPPQVAVYEEKFECVVPTETDKLNMTFAPVKTTWTNGLAKAYVDGVDTLEGKDTFSSEYVLDLSKYNTDKDSVVRIPLEIRYLGKEGTGESTRSTLIIRFDDLYPVITEQPEAQVNCGKGEDTYIEIEAESPNGGTLSYQWYKETLGGKSIIDGATESTLKVSTEFASQARYTCIVTNSKGEDAFSVSSKESIVTVVLTESSDIEAPVIQGVSEGGEYYEGTIPDKFSLTFGYKDKVDSFTVNLYRNTEDSTEGGEIVSQEKINTPGYVAYDKTTVALSAPGERAGAYYYYFEVILQSGEKTVSTYSATIPVVFKSYSDLIRLTGEGTQTNPYIINSYEDLLHIKCLVEEGYSLEEQNFLLNTDISLPADWKPIGKLKNHDADFDLTAVYEAERAGDETISLYEETGKGTEILPFGGIFNGGGHKVTVAKGGLPLFGLVRNATIKDLKIYGEEINGDGLIYAYTVDYGADGDYATGSPKAAAIENVTIESGTKTKRSGLLGGFASGANTVTIKNCKVEQGVIIGYRHGDYKPLSIGSFAGDFNGSIINCVSYADVYGENKVGGIAGAKGQSMGQCVVANCEFYGTVNSTGRLSGGILGSGYEASSAPNTPVATVKNCLVAGTITGKNYVGGIFGGEPSCENCWANGSGSVTDNVFCGSIHATEENATVGAIVGFMKSYNTNQEVNSNYFLDTCGAINSVGAVEIVHDSDFDIAKTGTSVAAQELKNNSVVKKLNSSYTSYKNWIQGENYPVHSCEPVAYQLEISGEYKSTYTIGEALNLAGIKVKANFSDGSSREVGISDIEVAGYDKTKRGIQAIKLAYGVASSTINVKVLKPDMGTITVSLTLLGDTKHGDDPAAGVHTLADDNLTTWMMKTSYEVGVNATVLDVLEKALGEGSILMDNPSGNYIKSLTKDGVKLGETDNGSNSGWMFTINGVHGNLGVAEQYLENGDEIVFHYTDDYTKENWDSGKTASEVIALIDALPEPDMLTLADAAAVAAANDGFSSLSDEDKTMVSQLKQDKLAAAVLKMAELRNASLSTFKDAYKTTGDYLAELLKGNETFGTEWPVIGLARAGRTADMDAAEYYADVEKTVEENGSSKLHASKSTENSRTILALTAIGKDVTDVAGYNLLEPLADLNYLKKQGINGPIWALIALDSHNYEIPKVSEEGVQATRENIIDTILKAELEDGGWALSGETADPDMTAMAIQALAPYYSGNAQVEVAVDKALDCLSALQNADGGYTSWGTTNSESCAQVLTALTALKIDPLTDVRFIKNGNSVMDALLGFYVEGGGFSHTPDGEVNGMATEQGYYALASYARMQAGKTSLYDMSDVTIGKAEEGNPPATQGGETESGKTPATGDESMPSGWSLIVLAAGAGILMTRKKKNAA